MFKQRVEVNPAETEVVESGRHVCHYLKLAE